MPKVSVVIPSYNHASIVGETIHSVLNQSFRDLELIVVDDASSDGSQEVLRSHAGDPRVKLTLLSQNVGAPVAMNVGAEQASGEYIAFCGSAKSWSNWRFLSRAPRLLLCSRVSL
jgi:teichuronic acid biosynthesis glycosyltransferase TuaG